MITLFNQISKSKPDYNEAIKRIRNIINKQQPELVFLLSKEWKNQQNYFTYSEIKQGLLSGNLTPSMIRQWNDDYTKFITNHLAPVWNKTMADAAKQISSKYPLFNFDPTHINIQNWTGKHAGELIVQLTDTQAKGINALLQMAATTNMSVDELAKAIRPTVGLHSRQIRANFNYFRKVRDNLLKDNPHMSQSTATKIATEKAISYAERQHQYRAMNIARTELAFAYNHGEFESVKQAIAQGYMGRVVKRWITAGDERVCPLCKELEDETEDLEYEFNTKNKGDRRTPPAHPSCRCCLEYIEVEAPSKIDTTLDINTPTNLPKKPDENDTSSDSLPLEFTSAMTFSQAYDKQQLDMLRKEFINRVENYNDLSEDLQDRILHDLNLLSARHLDIILSEMLGLEVVISDRSLYYRKKQMVYIESGFEAGEIIHELGHVIETRLDLYNDTTFLTILGNGLNNINPLKDIIVDNNFAATINRLDLDLHKSKFISEYQMSVYDLGIDGNGIYGKADEVSFNFKALAEYFSEGFREYYENPNNLKFKDINLYNFIKEL